VSHTLPGRGRLQTSPMPARPRRQASRREDQLFQHRDDGGVAADEVGQEECAAKVDSTPNRADSPAGASPVWRATAPAPAPWPWPVAAGAASRTSPR
jgi:hypothetical protein